MTTREDLEEGMAFHTIIERHFDDDDSAADVLGHIDLVKSLVKIV